MNEFMTLDMKAPATLESVLEAVVRLSEYDEQMLLELASEGRLRDLFPFRPPSGDIGADFVDGGDLIEAAPYSPGAADRKALIESSMSPVDAIARMDRKLAIRRAAAFTKSSL